MLWYILGLASYSVFIRITEGRFWQGYSDGYKEGREKGKQR